jgi:hypothetical protein
MGVRLERAQLREQARARRALLPQLRAAVRSGAQRKKLRLKECQQLVRTRRVRLERAARAAHRQLDVRIAAAKAKAAALGRICKTKTAPAELDRALAALEQERQQIAELRIAVARVRSDKGKKGGLRAGELRAESDDQVRRDIADDRLLVAAWDRVKGKIKATPRMSRTEAFLQHIHDHPEVLDEVRSKQEHKWAAEAESAFKALEQTNGRDCCAELERARRALADVPF